MSSLIVTGASGFVGSALVGSLQRAGHRVTALDHGHGDIGAAEYWISVPPAEHVIHLAGRSYIPASWECPSEFYATNVTGTARVLEYCRANRAHLVFVSAYIYGVPQKLPISEDALVAPNNPYALSKALAEQLCQFHAQTERLPVTIVRPFNIFGPRQGNHFLIPRIMDQIVRNTEIRVKDLSPRRDYLFIDDFVDSLQRTLASPAGLRVFNIGSGVSYTVQQIIDLAQTAAGANLTIVCEHEERLNEIPDVRADIGRARRQLGWEPRYSLFDGLKMMLDAMRR
jgi:GDP-4-dehydro-6-deoxy-D-mannose reductase